MIFVSDSNQPLRERAAGFLRALPRGAGCLLIAPTRAAAADFIRDHAAPGFAGVHGLTLAQTAAHLASPQLAARELRPASQLSLEALAARVIHTLHKAGRLEYFGPVADAPGFVRALAATLSELRMNGIELDRLAPAQAPGADLARLLAAFAGHMIEDRLADVANLYSFAVETARAGAHPFAGLPLLLLDVPIRSRRQIDLVEALAARAESKLALALASDQESVSALESALGVAAARIETPAVRTLDFARASMFAPELGAAPPRDSSIDVFSAPGEGLECVEIARRIRAAAASGVPFDRMAILLRAPERYQPLVEEALRRAAVPAWFQRGSARPDPAGRAFLALLACAAEGLPASRFAEYLSLAQVPPLDASGAPLRRERAMVAARDEVLSVFQADVEQVPEEPDSAPALATPVHWERLLVDAAVIGGRDRWARRIEGLERELRFQLAGVKIDSEPARLAIERKLEQLGALSRYVLPLIDLLAGLPAHAPWGRWLDALTALAETSLRDADSVLALLGEIRPMADVGPVGLDEVITVLAERLRFLEIPPVSRRYGAVFAAPIEQARGFEFDLVFLPGLAEGVFPRRVFEDPLLLDAHREKVSTRLARQDTRVERERLLLRAAAACCREKLVVSFPSIDVSLSRPRVPSFYALEIQRACEGRFPALADFAHRAAQGAQARAGWPAPEDPEQAIDDAEYDLARLQRLQGVPAEQARSRARYLVEVNSHLSRALRARWRRWDPRWSAGDGIVNPGAATLEILARHRLTGRPYSATALQNYAACPYKFFLYAIQQLHPRETIEAIEQLDPLTRGSLFHQAQFHALTRLKALGMIPLTAGNLTRAMDVLDTELDQVAAQYREQLAPAIPRVWNTEIEDLRTDLRGWLREAAVSDWSPLHFELGFGIRRDATRDPESQPDAALILDRVLLRGSIDVVEKHKVQDKIRVTDNKTGKPPERIPLFVGGGAQLQPLLYALAAERLLGGEVGGGRLFYCTQRGAYKEVDIHVTPVARHHAGRVLEVIDEAVATGFLPAAPMAGACALCDYRPVCGPYEEQRVLRKAPGRLDPLIELRRLP